MKLSALQRRILVTAGLAGDLSDGELARRTRSRAHVVRYGRQQLFSRGFARKAWIIDAQRLGYERCSFFFSIMSGSSKVREDFLRSLENDRSTIFLGELSGDFDYELSLVVTKASSAALLLKELADKYGVTFSQRALSIRLVLSRFPRKYLDLTVKSPISEITIGHSKQAPLVIDDLDHRILATISVDAQLSLREVARQLAVPASTVERRVRLLQQKKVIAGCVLSSNPRAYGAEGYVFLIATSGYSPKLAAALYSFAKAHPHCTYFIECAGMWEAEIGVEVSEYRELKLLREELSLKFGPQLYAIKTLARQGTITYSSYPRA